MIADGLRVTIPEVDPALRALADKRDDSMRLAYFDQSARTRGGRAAPFHPFEVTHPFAGYATEAEYLGNDPR